MHFRGVPLTENDGLRLWLLLHDLWLRLEIHLLQMTDGGRATCRGGSDEDLLLLLLLWLLELRWRLLVKLEDLNLLRLRLRFGVELRLLEWLLVEGGRGDRVENAADGESVGHRVKLLLLLLLFRLLNEELVLYGNGLGLICRWQRGHGYFAVKFSSKRIFCYECDN